jgi:hypothetical protein
MERERKMKIKGQGEESPVGKRYDDRGMLDIPLLPTS